MGTATESGRLRVVGQELEQRHVDDFDVQVETGGYRVWGHRAPAPPPPKAATKPARPAWALGSLFKSKTAAGTVEPEPELELEEWTRIYSLSDIDRLDDSYKVRRTRNGCPRDYAVSQVLRVIGAYIDEHDWALAGVSRKGDMLEIRHRDADGEMRTLAQRYAELYDFASHLLSARERA